MRRAGPLSRAGSVCRDVGMSLEHTKNQLRDYVEKFQRRDENLPCNRNCRANTLSTLNFASEQNGSPEDRYFSFYITHKGLSDHKAT